MHAFTVNSSPKVPQELCAVNQKAAFFVYYLYNQCLIGKVNPAYPESGCRPKNEIFSFSFNRLALRGSVFHPSVRIFPVDLVFLSAKAN